MIHFRSTSYITLDQLFGLFLNVHYHDSLSQQLKVVCYHILKHDSEGPSLITVTAFHGTPTETQRHRDFLRLDSASINGDEILFDPMILHFGSAAILRRYLDSRGLLLTYILPPLCLCVSVVKPHKV